MLFYYDNILLAKQVGGDMVPVESVDRHLLPLGLFGLPNEVPHTITLVRFLQWCCGRCFPRDRMDRDEVLQSLGLDEYNQLAIVEKTGAVLYGFDRFWVDFETEDSVHEWNPNLGVIQR